MRTSFSYFNIYINIYFVFVIDRRELSLKQTAHLEAVYVARVWCSVWKRPFPSSVPLREWLVRYVPGYVKETAAQAKSLTAQIIPSSTAFMSDVAASRRTWSRPLTRLLRTAKVKRPFFGCELERYLTSTEIWVRIATEPPLFNNFIKGYPEPNLRTCMERGPKALRETQPVKKNKKNKAKQSIESCQVLW